jgi:pyrroloquinoline quinone (PQQ) biosynthesis protein C
LRQKNKEPKKKQLKGASMSTPQTKEVIVSSIRKMQGVLESLEWQDPACYALWLSQTYFYVRHATRVLAKAAWRCDFSEEDLHKKLLNGINEEKNHEVMCSSDMEHIGFALGDFDELVETSAYYRTLYSMIDSHGPYALLGYFVSLEGLGAIGFNNVFAGLLKKYGQSGVQFVEVHAHLDEGHFEQGLNYIMTLPPDKQQMVQEITVIASQHYMNFLSGIKAHHQSRKSLKKTA